MHAAEAELLRGVARKGLDELLAKVLAIRLELLRVVQATEEALGEERPALERGEQDLASLVSTLRRELAAIDMKEARAYPLASLPPIKESIERIFR